MIDAPAATEPKMVNAERAIYDRLLEADGGDVSIASLYCAAFKVAPADLPKDMQYRQMRVGSPIATLNKKIAARREKVVTGEARRTYRLTRT